MADTPTYTDVTPSRTPIVDRERLREARGAGRADSPPDTKALAVRSAVPLPGPNLGQLLAGNAFRITEEDLSEAVGETAHGEVPDGEWENLTKQMIRSSCAFFAQEVLTGPPESPYNGRFFVSEHHEEWNKLICKYDRICIMAARDHSKTFFFDFAYPIWKAVTMPRGKGFILSATAPQAERILEDIIAEIESNPKLQYLVPRRSESRKWSSRYIKLSNGHRIYARGFGTKVRGFHPDYIVCDDVLNDETAYSEMTRKKQTDYYYNAISNMVVPGGQMITVGTPMHTQDLLHDLKDNPEYEFRAYPSTPEKPLWPERYDSAALAKKKREIGVIRFTREFAVSPVSDDMSLFPLRLFRGSPVEQFNVTLGMPAEYWEKAGISRYMGVDFAMSSNVGADYTVVWTMGLDQAGNRWIVDIQREHGMAYQDQLSLINSTARKYGPVMIFLEDNQMQRIFGDELIRTSDLPIHKFTTGVQKHSLDKGLPSLRVLLENRKFRIPRGDAHSVEMTDLWISEMQAMTWDKGKIVSVGAHDDLVMGNWICDQCIRHGGFQFSFGDDDYDGNLDDFLDEITGKTDKSAPSSTLEGGPGAVVKPDVAPPELEGEELLKVLLRRQMAGKKTAVQPKMLRPVPGEPGVGDLVNEDEFW